MTEKITMIPTIDESEQPILSILIVNWNTKALLKSCIKSILYNLPTNFPYINVYFGPFYEFVF